MPNLLDNTGSLLRWWKKKKKNAFGCRCSLKPICISTQKNKLINKMSTRGRQGKAAFLFAWGFKALKRFDLCPTFSQLIPHVFDSQSKPALARCSLSPLPKPPHYSVSRNHNLLPVWPFSSQTLSATLPRSPTEALCLFHNCGWVKIHLPDSPLPSLLAKSRPLCQVRPQLVCSRGVCVGRQRFSNAFFVEKKKKRGGGRHLKKETPSRLPWMIKHAVKHKDAIKDEATKFISIVLFY